MRSSLRFKALSVAIATFVSASAYGQSLHPNTQLVIADVESIVGVRNRLNDPREKTTPLAVSAAGVADARSPEAKQRSGAVLVGALVINKELLRGDGPRTSSNDAPPTSSGILTVQIDGRELTLLVADEVNDAARQLRHVTAVIDGEAQSSYARFTIDDKTGLLVGTVSSSAGLYRLISRDATTQFVYRLDAETLREGANLRAIASVEVAPPEVEALERRHTQAELVADVQPWFFRITNDDYSMRVRGGDLGFLNVSSLDDKEPVLSLLARLAPATGFSGAETIELLSVPTLRRNEDRGEYAVRYRQTINGIPVNKFQEITVDQSGKVIAVQSSLLDPTKAPAADALLSQEAAAQLASAALRQSTERSSAQIDSRTAPELMYRVSGPNHDPVPEWSFPAVSVGADRNLLVVVNAVSGEAVVRSAVLRAHGEDYRHRIWNANGPTEIYREIHDAETECLASEPVCEQEIFSMANYMVNTIGAGSEQYTDSATCCLEMGNDVPGQSYNRLDVFVDDDSIPGSYGEYQPVAREIRISEDYSTSVDVVAHEMAHAHLHAYNPTVVADVSEFAGTYYFTEGIADAYAAMVGELYPGFSPGDPWVNGDSSPALDPGDVKDMTVSQDFADGGSEKWGNFFYRVYQDLGSSYKGRLFELTMQVQKNIEDAHADGIDERDFVTALEDSLRPGDSALAAALSEAVLAMSTGSLIYELPPHGVILSATPNGCAYPQSRYILNWTGSALASYFEFEYLNGFSMWTYDNSWGGTSIFAFVGYSTSWRTRACNAYGCSGYSNAVSTPHNQC